MKRLVLILCSAFSINGFAQIPVLSSSNTSSVGDTVIMVGVDSTQAQTIQHGPGGASQTWTIPALTKKDSTVNAIVTVASTPYASDFPTANYASHPIPDVSNEYDYNLNNSSGGFEIGQETSGTKTVYY